ncbi:unnamed protein product [Dicrocoelium dendriticum]|nr:unnamed protein product [Dicrocoelium dendriticum]
MGFLSMYGIRDLNSFYQFKEPTFTSNHIFWDPLLTADEMLCSRKEMLETVRVGTDIEEAPIRARHSFMAMQLNSTGAQLPGMKAEFRLRYRFERGFAVPGLQSNPTNCHFIYTPSLPIWMRNNAAIRHMTSTARLHRSGWTNSPFYPLPYPSNITCVYMFLPEHISSSGNTSAIRLSFGHFELTSVESFPTSETSPLDGRPQCNRDFLEVVAIRGEITSIVLNQLVSQPAPNLPARTRHWEHSWRNYWNTMNRGLQSLSGGQRSFIDPIAAYCGTNIPGPVLSDPGVTAFLVRFHSGRNAKHGGFTLKYEFVEHHKGECGGNIGSFLHGGVIESPKHPQPYPHNLDCRWQLQISNPENVIQLHFDAFYLSANIGNCSQAVLRIYTGAATDHLAELCTNQTAMTPLLLPGASVTIRFTALRNDEKATGFRIIWTEIFPALKDGTCEGFQCAHSKHCISKHLVCDGTPNCGVYSKANRLDPDDSDENANCNFSSGAGAITYNFVHISVGVIMTFVLLFVLIGIVYYRERKRRRMHMDPLAELTGSKHSLAPSQASNKSYHRQSHPRKCDTGHAHIHSRQNSRTHLSMDNSRTSVYSSTYRSSKRHPRSQDRRTNHIVPRSNLIPSHNCTSRYQLIPIHNLPKQSSHHSPGRHRSKSPCRMTHGHSCTLRRTGSHRSGSSRSGRMSHGATSCVLSGDNDSGHLTRERMQTISIV